MAVPQIDLLPPPALPTDPEDVFDAKVGASLTAEQNLVPQLNASLTWIGQQVTAVDGYRQAAATSAANAATSAGNAAAQVALAAAQVTLANTARSDAQAARDSAQASALAAGAAAGLPPQRIPFSVLQINAAGNVAWGYGVPDTSAAVVGQALILGAGKVPAWGYAGPQIGDILYTSRNPGTGYLPASGGIYLQSAYPALYAQIGLIGGLRGKAFSNPTTALPSPNSQMALGDNNTALMLLQSRQVYRSTNKGSTFSATGVTLSGSSIPVGLLYLGNSIWIAFLNDGLSQRSLDDGVTWEAAVNRGTTITSFGTDGNGVVVFSNSTVTFISYNYGGTFTSPYAAVAQKPTWLGGTRWAWIASGNTANVIFISDDYFVTQKGVSTGLSGSAVGSLAYDKATNTAIIGNALTGTTAINLSVSPDGGESWTPIIAGGTNAVANLLPLGSNTWLALTADSASQPGRISVDGGKTFGPMANGSTTAAASRQGTTDGKGRVILFATVQPNSYSISDPVLGYDPATQFKLPNLLKQEGSIPYVRAA